MIVNGQVYSGEQAGGKKIGFIALAKEFGFDLNCIALEVNGTIIEQDKYEHLILGADDVVEVVQFVGGG